MTDEDREGAVAEEYGESVVVTRTVRLVTPFVFTLGLFTMFHGTDSLGGGFQGGVVVASAIVTIAFAFGVGQTATWLDEGTLVGVAVAGVVVFTAVVLAPLAYGGTFLELTVFPWPKAAVYAIELVELAIGVTVAAVVVVLFFEISGAGGGE